MQEKFIKNLINKVKQKIALIAHVLKIWHMLLKTWVGFYGKDVILYYLAETLIPISGLISLFIGGSFIDIAVNSIKTGQSILSPKLISLFAAQILVWVLGVFSYTVGEYYSRKISAYREAFHDYWLGSKMAKLPPAIFEDPKLAQLSSRVNSNAWQISALTYNLVFGTVFSILLLAYVVILAHFNKSFVVAILLVALIKLVANIKYGAEHWNIWDSNSDAKVKYGSYAYPVYNEEPQQRLFLRVLNLNNWLINRAIELTSRFAKKQVENERKRYTFLTITELLGLAVWAWVLYVLLNNIAAGVLTVGAFYVVYGIFKMADSYTEIVFRDISAVLSDIKLHKDFYKFITLPEEGAYSKTSENSKSKGESNKPSKVKDVFKNTKALQIEFKDVWFKYPKSKNWVLKGVSFKINAGENFALVGKNGAGKTTIVKLLMGMYAPQKGEILINGYNLQNLNLDEYYEQVGLLLQRQLFLQVPVKELIFSARPPVLPVPNSLKKVENMPNLEKYIDKPKVLAKIREATKFVGMHNTIMKMPKKYNTWLRVDVPNGVDISGGQWQKLNIAQMVYRDPKLLVLDEPTSAIDALAEEEIFNKIFEYAKEKTVLIISHRFATVKRAQKIMVLQNGKIIEQGTHSQLVKAGGLYAKMYKAQVR